MKRAELATIGAAAPVPYVPGEAALKYIEASLRPETSKMYLREFKAFAKWCAARGTSSLPADPHVIADYLVDDKIDEESKTRGVGLRPRASIERIRAAISAIHAGHASYLVRSKQVDVEPTNPARDQIVARALKGLYRTATDEYQTARKKNPKVEPPAPKARPPQPRRPITRAELGRLLQVCSKDIVGSRDRAVFAVCWYSGLRRGELVALNRSDLEFTDEVLIISLPRSKTNQTGKAEYVTIARLDAPYNRDKPVARPFCPVQILEEWLDKAEIDEGAVFRNFRGSHGRSAGTTRTRLSDAGAQELMKGAALRARLPNAARLGMHSMRRGVLTELARRGVPVTDIARHGRHRNLNTTMGYVDEADRRSGGPTKVFRDRHAD
jgi:integrase